MTEDTDSSTKFYIVSHELTFEESLSTDKYAIISATVLELEKPSEGNNRVYKFEEAESIAESLIGKPVYYGVTPFGKHENPLVSGKNVDPVGFVDFAEVVGNKIKALIKITSSALIETLKRGTKYLFSVGGNAIRETLRKIGNKIVHVLHGAKCNHLQILDLNTPVGFPNAQMEKLIEINETVMICENGVCSCKPVIEETEEAQEPDEEYIFRISDSTTFTLEGDG
jgi:hypothetical protein